MHRLRKTLRDVVEPVPAQADAPEPGLSVGQAMQRLRQGVRQHARARHAPSHAQAVARMRRVRQDVQPAVASAGPPAVAHRREAVHLRAVWQSVRGPVQPARAHDDPLGRQELRVPLVPQVVRAQVVPEQAPGGGLRAGLRGRRRLVAVVAAAAAEAGRP